MFVVMAECVLQHCPLPTTDCFGKIFGINNNSNFIVEGQYRNMQ